MTKKRCAMLQTCAQENKRFLFCDGILVWMVPLWRLPILSSSLALYLSFDAAQRWGSWPHPKYSWGRQGQGAPWQVGHYHCPQIVLASCCRTL
jgi:hypothetical protein